MALPKIDGQKKYSAATAKDLGIPFHEEFEGQPMYTVVLASIDQNNTGRGERFVQNTEHGEYSQFLPYGEPVEVVEWVAEAVDRANAAAAAKQRDLIAYNEARKTSGKNQAQPLIGLNLSFTGQIQPLRASDSTHDQIEAAVDEHMALREEAAKAGSSIEGVQAVEPGTRTALTPEQQAANVRSLERARAAKAEKEAAAKAGKEGK